MWYGREVVEVEEVVGVDSIRHNNRSVKGL